MPELFLPFFAGEGGESANTGRLWPLLVQMEKAVAMQKSYYDKKR